MIAESEIIGAQDVPEAYKADLKTLLERINIIRAAYGKAMTVTSGYRSWNHHVEIYKKKALQRGVPFYIDQVPKKSKHLYCQALDIGDANGDLKKWILLNIKLLEDNGLWCEDFSATKTWVHFQIYQPASGKRFFMP